MLLFVFAAVFSLGLKCDSLLYILSVLVKQFHNPEYSTDTRTYCTVKRRKKLKIFFPPFEVLSGDGDENICAAFKMTLCFDTQLRHL